MQMLYRDVHLMLFMIILTKICLIANESISAKYYTKGRKLELREDVRKMFQHAYDGYLEYAANYDELRPLSCDGHDTWGSYSLTLIDALDTLATMGNFTEFRRVVALLEQKMNFDRDINVSVFETNIRIVGGLLSAHLLTKRAGCTLEPGWPCQGPLLRLAEDVAHRLLPAFDTATGMPYGTVNLRYGVPKGETPVTCTAGVGTFLIEFGTLSRLTGKAIYEEVALNAIFALWQRRSSIGLFGNHIDVQTGRWTALDSGIGAGVDSFFEYLVKGAILLNRPDLLQLFHEAREPIDKYLRKEDWYIWAGMNKGHVTLPIFQSLESFWPGILGMIGDHGPALRTITNYINVWKKYGFLPEFYNIPAGEAVVNREVYPLRPELIESAMYLYRATKNHLMLELGEIVLESLEFSAKTKCGYATIRNVVTHEKENRMESFFLAETTKYLYLLFDEDNFLHDNGVNGVSLETNNGVCAVQAGAYIFNTEAHPMDMSALYCCHDIYEDIYAGQDLKKYHMSALTKATYKEHFQNMPCQLQTHVAKHVDVEKNATKRQQQTTNGLSVDIQVYDEFNNPAGDMLVANFERVIYKREMNVSGIMHFDKQIPIDRNQLTVNDLEYFFKHTRVNFQNVNDVYDFVKKFMQNFTMDVAFIRGLQLLDKNIINVLGDMAQNKFEAQMRTLWELYELEQRFLANIQLLKHLGLQTTQYNNDDAIVETEESSNLEIMVQQQFPLDEILAILEHGYVNGNNESTFQINKAIHDVSKAYEFALINTTAMQTFLYRIYKSGTSDKQIDYLELLDAYELEILNVNINTNLTRASDLFSYAKHLVDFKKRMNDTMERLQTLMDTKNAQYVSVRMLDENSKSKEDSSISNMDTGNYISKTGSHMSLKTEQQKQQSELATTATATTTATAATTTTAGSVWTQFIQSILSQTMNLQRVKFNERLLRENTRKSLQRYASKLKKNYYIFSCKRQNFIEYFAYRDFHPVI